MTELQPKQDNTADNNEKLRGLWGTSITAALGLTFLIFWAANIVFPQHGHMDFTDKTLWTVPLLLLLAGVGGFLLIRKGRLLAGLWVAYWALIIPPVLAVLVISNFYVTAVAYLVVFATISAGWIFPKNARRTATIAAGAALLAILGIEAWHPAFRGTASNLSGFAPYAITAGAVAMLAFSVRQAINGNIRTKLIVSFVAIAVLSVGTVAFLAQRSLSASLTESIGSSRASFAKTQAVQIGQTLQVELNLLNTLALTKAVRERAQTATSADKLGKEEINSLDREWQAADAANDSSSLIVAVVLNDPISTELGNYQKQFPDNVEVFLTDLPGVIVGSTDRTSDYLQSDEAWWQTALQQGEYVGQPEYDASSKTLAINMAVAVRSTYSDQVVGILRTTVNIKSLGSILAAGQMGQTGHTDIYLPDKQVVTLAKAGNNAAELTVVKAEQDIESLAEQSDHYFTASTGGIPSLNAASAVAAPASEGAQESDLIKNLGWQVLVQQDQAEALAPVQTQTQSLLLLALVMAIVAAVAGVGLAQLLSGPIVRLNLVAEKVAAGDLALQARIETKDETGALAATFNSMVSQLREMIGSLERRVSAATQNLTLAAEVGRSVSQVRALDVMLKDASELIRSQFGLYYTQVYLVDSSRANLILQSGTGSVGEELVHRAHRLPVNGNSINGRAALERHAVVIPATATSDAFRPNPLLPDTRSEMAVPLLIGDRVVGVLDLQSSQAGALSQEVLPAFEALAGQLAIAIQNANLLAEAEQARAELEKQAARQARIYWKDYLDAVHKPENVGFVFQQNELTPLAETGELEPGVKNQTLTAPISVTGEPIGKLVVELDSEKPTLRTSELVNAVARQVSQHIESLRLIDSAERYRFEAEESSRRLTHEGWKGYVDSKSGQHLGYMYDLKEVVSVDGAREEDGAVSLSLKVHDEPIGKLSILELDPNDKESMDLANSIAERLSTHIESLRLSEQVEKRAYELATIASVSTEASSTLDPALLLQSVVDLTKESFNLYHAHIYLINEAGDALELATGAGETGKQMVAEGRKIRLDQERSLVARAARARQAVIVNDVQNEPGWLPNPLLPNTASEMAVPMIVGDHVLGVLDVQSERLNAFSEEDANIQATLAFQVATALQNARSFKQTQSALAQSEKLFDTSRRLTQATDLQELVSAVVSVLDIPNINRAVLTTFNYDSAKNLESLDIIANWWNGNQHEVTPVGTHYPLDVIRAMPMFVSPTPVFFNDTHTDERVDKVTMELVKRQNLRSVAVLPLHVASSQIGALVLEGEEPQDFTQDEMRLFSALAPQIATVLENRRQYQRAQQQAERESMLNVISQKIQGATSVEAVLQIAARELGHALGAPLTIAQLGLKERAVAGGNGNNGQSA